VSFTNYNPAIDGTVFPSTPPNYFWTSSPYVGSAANGWTVNFSGGYSAFVGTSNAVNVRCVR
jgi:hypothetical protein